MQKAFQAHNLYLTLINQKVFFLNVLNITMIFYLGLKNLVSLCVNDITQREVVRIYPRANFKFNLYMSAAEFQVWKIHSCKKSRGFSLVCIYDFRYAENI